MSGTSAKQTSDSKSNVPEEVKADLLKFKSLTTNPTDKCCLDKKSLIVDLLKDQVRNAANPYLYVLDLVYYSSDVWRTNSSTFNRNVLQIFHEMLQEKEIKTTINLEVKKKAINMFIQMKNSAGIEIACEIFNLREDRASFKDIIENHVESGHYQQVCPVIIALDMQPFFTLEQIVLHLIFRDQRGIVERYLQFYPEMQLQLVKMLDAASNNRGTLSNFISKYHIQSKIIAKFDTRYMQKLVGKLLNAFNIPIEECPCLLRNRSYGALNYMIRKRFQDHEMTDDAFEEMALNAVKDNSNLQQELLLKLVCLNENSIALKLAKALNLKPKLWPSSLRTYTERNPARVSSWRSEPEECWDKPPNEPQEKYLSLRIDKSCIYFINTLETFMNAIETIEAYDVVGFDAEWRPSFGVKVDSKLSLLQLAVWDCVFLLDVLSLTQCLEPQHWSCFIERIFSSQNILKLGFATNVDLDMLKTYCSGNEKNLKFRKVLDLNPFLQKILVNHPDIKKHLPVIDETSQVFTADKGLSKICRIFLGIPLNKIEQFSDWERRPLREAQIIYAALDAFSLLQIYERIFSCLQLMGSSFDEVIENYFKPKNELKPEKGLSKNDKHAQLQSMVENKKINYSRSPIPISEFKVVVDNMLNGLGKELRICGADVVILENNSDHSEAVKIALAQKRCFITTGKVFNQLAGYMSPGMCFCVTIGPLERQMSDVCEYFNIYCTEDDVFTRCTLCNCDHYLKITSKDMEALWISYKCISPSPLHENRDNLKPFIRCGEEFVTVNGTMSTGNKILLEGLSERILSENSVFYVCSQCGKIYWEGSHHRRKKESVVSWLNSNSKENDGLEQSCSTQKALETPSNSTSHKEKTFSMKYYTDGELSSGDDDDYGIVY